MTPPSLPLAAYVDTTSVLPISSGEEPVAAAVQQRLGTFPHLLSSNVLEAELRVAFQREGQDFDSSLIANINWIFPNRRLDAEMTAVLEFAHLSHTRMWHLATAIFFRNVLQSELAFVTLDEQQETAARELGFFIP